MHNERTWLKGKVDEKLADMQRAGVRIWFLKVHGGPMQRAGVPDFLICVEGYFAAIELKSPDDDDPQPAPRQMVELRGIRAAGGTCRVCNSVECVVAVVDSLCSTVIGLGEA